MSARESLFEEVARVAGWEPDDSIPVQDHGFYEQRRYWRNGVLVEDEYHLRKLLGFEETAR